MAQCPSCGSVRLRNGYRTAPLPLRVIGIRTLLCDNCNFEFRSFCPREPKHGKRQRSKRKADVFNAAPVVDLQTLEQPGVAATRRQQPAASFDRAALPVQAAHQGAAKVARPALPDLPEDFDADLQPRPVAPSVAPSVGPSVGPSVREALPGNMRARVSAPSPPLPTEEPLMKLKEDLAERRKNGTKQTCPQCASPDVSRRHRRLWQRIILGLTQIRPYRCDSCGHKFYASRRPHKRRKALTQSEAELLKNSCFNLAEGKQAEGGQAKNR